MKSQAFSLKCFGIKIVLIVIEFSVRFIVGYIVYILLRGII